MSLNHFERLCLHLLKASHWLTFEQPALGAAESERILCIESAPYRDEVVRYMRHSMPNLSKISAIAMHCVARGNQWSCYSKPNLSFVFLCSLCFLHFSTMTYAIMPLIADLQALSKACNCFDFIVPCLAALLPLGNVLVSLGLAKFKSTIPMFTILTGECALTTLLLVLENLLHCSGGEVFYVQIACVLVLIGGSNALIWSQLSAIAASQFAKRYFFFRGMGTMGSLAACLCIYSLGSQMNYFLSAHGSMIMAVACVLTPRRIVPPNKVKGGQELRLDQLLKVAVLCVAFCETVWGFLAFITLTAMLQHNGLLVLQVAGFAELTLLIGVLPLVSHRPEYLLKLLVVGPVGWFTVSVSMQLSALYSWCALVSIVSCVNAAFFALILRDLPRKKDQQSILLHHAVGGFTAFVTIAVFRGIGINDFWLWLPVLTSALIAMALTIRRQFTEP